MRRARTEAPSQHAQRVECEELTSPYALALARRSHCYFAELIRSLLIVLLPIDLALHWPGFSL